MKRRLLAVVVIVAGLIGQTAMTTGPAHATTFTSVLFTGVTVLAGPLSHPCTPGFSTWNNQHLTFTHALCPQGFPVPNFNALLTPLTLTTTPLPGPMPLVSTTNSLPLAVIDIITVELGNAPYVHGGQSRAASLGTVTCLTSGLNINKPGKPVFHNINVCDLSASGVTNGWCGLSTSKLTGTLFDALGQLYFLDLHFYEAGVTFVNGHWVKPNGQVGNVRGVFNQTAPPGPTPPFNNSCVTLTATTFLVAGSLALFGITGP